ncbi:MAG: hypothetical protein LBQ38_06030 [Spirochaetaceae bacterium]|jgi:hypothetical protein|nr:hypothetical protein [Spirochaetaceae bacterium]
MKKHFVLMELIGVLLVFGLILAGCDNGTPGNSEELRWSKWVDDSSSATLTYDVGSDGVCNITIGGTPNPDGQGVPWEAWKAQVQYSYSGEIGKTYIFTFDWWADGSTFENVAITYARHDDSDPDKARDYPFGDGMLETIPTNQETKTFEATIPEGANVLSLKFSCGSDTGTFHIANISIREK